MIYLYSSLLFLFELGAIAYLGGTFWQSGYKKGHEHGYAKGRTDAEKWIVELESGVNEARQEIWRGEETA